MTEPIRQQELTDTDSSPDRSGGPTLLPTRSRHLTVVGIGASAGGLNALKSFFSCVPADSGVAWVVVVHLAPDHESRLAELLQPHAVMPVKQVTETTLLEPDHIYVIPPKANLNAIDTHLRLSGLEELAGRRASVDHFFRTLARTHEGHAVGVILSGTGSDGAQGIREVRAKGGVTLAQDPEDAEYDAMPRSAIATGDVDAVLPVTKLPEAVLRLSRVRPPLPLAAEESALSERDQRVTEKIVALVRARTGRDFSRYKRLTVLRRIARRMHLRHVQELPGYLDLLREDPAEVEALADDMLITVTSFFRDPDVFAALEREVIPRLFDGKGPADRLRVWSVGCATGEEAYSLAILLLEEAQRHRNPPRLQVFATDIHAPSLERAREGYYSGDIEADVGAERLERFFRLENGRYRVQKEVRELVLFSPHDLLADPPFSQLSLIACRNVLIYLQRDVQRDVIKLFHYCLVPDGALVLGTSETTDASGLFDSEDKEHRIYRRRGVAPEIRIPIFPLTRARDAEVLAADEPREAAAPGALHHRMVEWYAPPSLLVDADDTVVHLSENVGRFLVHAGGEPTTSVFKIVPEELRIELRVALQAARHADDGQAVYSKPVSVHVDGEPATVVLCVRQSAVPSSEGYALVVFDEQRTPQSGSAAEGRAPELASTDRGLQAIVEDYEASQQQLRTANEELQSSNEELRATMEELETSKEELQSINEELQAVNEENRHKVEELAQLSSDLQNLLVATDIATLFIDRRFRILRFTPKVAELFSILPSDRGRAISDLTRRLNYAELLDDAKTVLDRLSPVERVVQDEGGRWYLTRSLPYRTTDDRIEGVVITFVDITDRKRLEDEVRSARKFADDVIRTTREPLLVLEPDLRVHMANPAFLENFNVNPEDTVGRYIYDLGNGQWDIPELRELLERVLPETNVFNDFEVEHEFEDLGLRVMLINARQLDHTQLILLGIRDITDFKRREEELQAAREAAEQASRIKSQFLSTMSHELRTPLNAVIGLSELIETEVAGPATTEQRTYLARIKRAAWHLVRVIEDILTYSRSEAGRERLRIAETDLGALALEVIGMLDSAVVVGHREIRLTGADQPVPAVTDPDKVRQVLTNLVGNAIKYGEGRVDLDLDASDEEWIEFRVTDRGPGIPPDQLESIFQPFVQVGSTGLATADGTGLGLTICRDLAHLMGGDVTVESVVGEGSTFTLRLPRNAAGGPASQREQKDG